MWVTPLFLLTYPSTANVPLLRNIPAGKWVEGGKSCSSLSAFSLSFLPSSPPFFILFSTLFLFLIFYFLFFIFHFFYFSFLLYAKEQERIYTISFLLFLCPLFSLSFPPFFTPFSHSLLPIYIPCQPSLSTPPSELPSHLLRFPIILL